MGKEGSVKRTFSQKVEEYFETVLFNSRFLVLFAVLGIMILIVEFFKQAFTIEYNRVIDLLFLAIGIMLLAGSLFLTRRIFSEKAEENMRQIFLFVSRGNFSHLFIRALAR